MMEPCAPLPSSFDTIIGHVLVLLRVRAQA